MARKQGPGFSMRRGSSPNFKDLGSKPPVPKDDGKPSQEELIAQADAKFGDKIKITPKSDMLNKIKKLQEKQELTFWNTGKDLSKEDDKLLKNLVANYKKGKYGTKDKPIDPDLLGEGGIRGDYLRRRITATPEDKIDPYKKRPGDTDPGVAR